MIDPNNTNDFIRSKKLWLLQWFLKR